MDFSNHIKELIPRITKGDHLAFSKFYHLYFPKLLRFAHFFVQNDDACYEIISDVYLNLWSNREKFNDIKNLDGYLYTSLRNQALKYKQKQKNRIESIEDFNSIQEFTLQATTPDDSLINQEQLNALNQSINSLPPRCKAIFILIREEGYTYKQVADLMQISEKTVQAQLCIAVKKIMDLLSD